MTMLLFALFAAYFCLFSFALLLLAPALAKPSLEAERMLALVHTEREDRRVVPLRERMTVAVVTFSTRLRAMLGLGANEKLRQRMQRAGIRHAASTDTFFAAQGLGILVGGIGGSLLPENTFFWIFAGVILGFMAPDFWLTARGNSRKARMRRSIPDTIDLMVICVEAKAGLDQALLRVRESLSLSHPDLSTEFERLNYELLAGTPRLEAWQRLAARTRIEELASFATILAETDRFGTPIVKALGDFSEELRLKRRQHAEEAAAKTKIKIIFPLVLCIFPCIFIVLLAPALLNIASGMKSVGN
jgi:tight adherence protein C